MTGEEVLGAVLAGGLSRRFGSDKSAATVGGVSMVRRVLDAVAPVTGAVVVVSPRPVPEAEEGRPPVPRVVDRVPGSGPLGGLHAALLEARERGLHAVLLLGCDLPLVSSTILEALLRARGEATAVAPRSSDGGPQVLCALYATAVLPAVEARLEGRDRSLRALFDAVGGRTVEAGSLGPDAEALLLNVNEPEDRERAEQYLAGSGGAAVSAASPGPAGSGSAARGAARAAASARPAAPGPGVGAPPLVCVVGKKRSGKTTTVVGLVRALGERGHRVMTVKHGHHFRLDREGTDSWRHRHEGGAARVVLAGPEGMAVAGEWGPGGEEPLERLAARFLGDADVVVAEGFKASSAARVEVYRRAVHPEPLYVPGDGRYLAVLTDVPGFPAHVPVLEVDDPERFGKLAELVEARLLL